jgi:hypothetical protein
VPAGLKDMPAEGEGHRLFFEVLVSRHRGLFFNGWGGFIIAILREGESV